MSAPSHQPIGGAGTVAKFIKLPLNSLYSRIRSRTRGRWCWCWCWCRQGASGWTASESAPSFCLKLAPIRLNVTACLLQSTASIAETATATVVASHHGIETIDIGVAVVVESSLRVLHGDVFGQALTNMCGRAARWVRVRPADEITGVGATVQKKTAIE